MDEEVPEFSSIETECAFWKSRARELKTELDEFTEDSHQLEKELEITIKLKEDQLTDLRHKYQRQQHEIDSLMAKLKQSENESLQWEQRYKKEKAEGEVLRKHTRELEQKNDDLERAHRIVSESVTEFERMLNREYEKNVMLEVEYEMEKENSQIQLQRLMDEARDLKQELKIQQKQPGTVRKDDDDGTGDEDKNHNKPGDTTKRRRAESTGSQVDNKEADEAVKRLSNDTEVEKAELEKGASERRSSVKMDSDKATTNGIGNGLCNEQSSDVPAPATAAQQTSSVAGSRATASMHRQNSLKQMERLKHGNSMTASSRSTALAIVADLLRRVNNIDATLKELKRPKSLDDDLADEDDGTTTIHSTRSEKAKSPSLIC